MCAPTCVLTYYVSKGWERWRLTRVGKAIAAGLTPVTVGFVGASALLLSRGADTSWRLAAVTAATALVAWRTKLNPLWCLAAAAGLGLAGALG
jgi:chromate transporter